MQALYVLPQGRPNEKTGPVIQQYIGQSTAESMQSCTGCPLLETRTCYAQYGTPRMGFASMLKARARGKGYSLRNALAQGKAKWVRFGALGDPSAVTDLPAHIKRIRAAGLGILGYTHFWASRGAHLLGQVMASCDNWTDAFTAIEKGWRATLYIGRKWFDTHPTQGTYAGIKYTLCPAQRNIGVQCADCGLCDATRKAVPLILFREHGPMERN